MIEINLLPGSGKKKSSRSGGGAAKKINFGAFFANITQKIRDPWLISAVGTVVASVVIVGGTYLYQEQRVSSLGSAETVALADSARYAAALKERASAIERSDISTPVTMAPSRAHESVSNPKWHCRWSKDLPSTFVSSARSIGRRELAPALNSATL